MNNIHSDELIKNIQKIYNLLKTLSDNNQSSEFMTLLNKLNQIWNNIIEIQYDVNFNHISQANTFIINLIDKFYELLSNGQIKEIMSEIQFLYLSRIYALADRNITLIEANEFYLI